MGSVFLSTFATIFEHDDYDTIQITEGRPDGSTAAGHADSGDGPGAAGENQYQYAAGGHVGQERVREPAADAGAVDERPPVDRPAVSAERTHQRQLQPDGDEVRQGQQPHLVYGNDSGQPPRV